MCCNNSAPGRLKPKTPIPMNFSPTLSPLGAFLTMVITLSLPSLKANPIAIDSSNRPTTMTAEKVLVSVGKDHSTVRGSYTFRQEEDDWPHVKDTHVTVYVPVLVPTKGVTEYERQFGTPAIWVRGKKFTCDINNDLSSGREPKSPELPRGWHMRSYEAKIPLNLVGKTFKLDITYTQPHFPRQKVGYVPLLPPKDTSNSDIVFEATAGHLLRREARFPAFQPKHERLSFKPEDGKLLVVQSVDVAQKSTTP